jgi:hypothetical protein
MTAPEELFLSMALASRSRSCTMRSMLSSAVALPAGLCVTSRAARYCLSCWRSATSEVEDWMWCTAIIVLALPLLGLDFKEVVMGE